MKELFSPLSKDELLSLRAGETVLLSGTIYTARDAAHKKLCELLKSGEELPLPKGCCVYYAGPCPAAPGEVIGPCGPTTAARMDAYTPQLILYGLNAMIGKGPRSETVKKALEGRAVYFAATGGAGMLIASHITECELIAFPELGAEAVYKLKADRLPLIVACDAAGGDLYARKDEK